MNSEGDGLPLVEAAAFEACVLDAPVAILNQIDMPTLSLAYHQAAATTISPCKEVYALLAAITGIHLNPAERGSMWIPGGAFGDRRTMLPSDIRGAQSDMLEVALPRIQHPAVRARVSDVIWTNDLRKGPVAKIAVDAYCDCVEGLIAGVLVSAYPITGRDLMDAQTPAHRALQIASATNKRGMIPDRLRNALSSLYSQALKDGQHVIFSRIAQLCCDYKIVDIKQVASDCEVIAAINLDTYPEAVRIVWDFAGQLYRRLSDTEAQQRCEMGAVRQMLKMRDECGQPGAKAAWVMDALLRLRHIKSTEAQALEVELENELRRLQRASTREMGTFAINIEIPEERERIVEMFSTMDFSTTLKSFAMLDNSPKLEDLKASVLEQGRSSPLSSMMGVNHVDEDGKTIVKTAGAGDGEPPEDWFVHMIGRAESLRRAMVVANNIEPIRLLINGRIPIEERHFNPIVWQSHFVPQPQAPLYALGFSRFFQGDFPSAAHLLIPQLEPSLRHILKAHGVDPTKRRDDATEEDRSLDAIIVNHHAALEQILGAPLLQELDRIFNQQPGPSLRHDVAHGQMSAGQCYSPDVSYACWLLYRVCCLFLFEHWDEWVRPGLEMEEPGR